MQHLTAMSIDKIAIFYQNDAYGQAGLAGVERALKKRKLELAARGTVERNTVEVKTGRGHDDQGPAAGGDHDQRLQVVRGLHQGDEGQGANPTFWNVSFVGSKALAKELDKEGRGVQISQVVPFPWDSTIPVVKEYRKLLDEAKGEPGFGTLEGFIAAKVMVEGLQARRQEPRPRGLRHARWNRSTHDMGGFKVSFAPDNHSGSQVRRPDDHLEGPALRQMIGSRPAPG